MESKSVLKRLCVQDPIGMSEKLHDKDAEIERLNALLTMKTEALNAVISAQKGEVKDFVLKAINATKETVSEWQLKRDAEIMARSLEGAADWYDYQDAIGNKAYKYNRVQDDLRRMASELRAKGE